jgi:hypothetical protein
MLTWSLVQEAHTDIVIETKQCSTELCKTLEDKKSVALWPASPLSPFITTHIFDPTHLSISSIEHQHDDEHITVQTNLVVGVARPWCYSTAWQQLVIGWGCSVELDVSAQGVGVGLPTRDAVSYVVWLGATRT